MTNGGHLRVGSISMDIRDITLTLCILKQKKNSYD